MGRTVIIAALLLAACSSSGGGGHATHSVRPTEPSNVTTPAAPATSPTNDPPTSEPAAPSTDPLDDPDAAAANEWLNTAPHRLDVEGMAADAAAVRRSASGDASMACTELIGATYKLDDDFPKLQEPGNADPLVQALLNASTQYNFAGQSCDFGVTATVRAYLRKGDAAVKQAERRARILGTRI